MTSLDIFRRFVGDIQASTYYKQWSKGYPAERDKWVLFREAILASKAPVAPSLNSYMGKALVDAGSLYLTSKQLPFTVYITEEP